MTKAEENVNPQLVEKEEEKLQTKLKNFSPESCFVDFEGLVKATRMTLEAVWMERLRSKSSHFKTLAEQSKSARVALLERRYGLDSEEKSALRSCLDHLSEAIPVRDYVSMAERLEAIARKITSESGSLSFMAAPVHGCFYLSTEMFYVEINIDSAGIVQEAKVHHIDTTQPHQQPTNRVSQAKATGLWGQLRQPKWLK